MCTQCVDRNVLTIPVRDEMTAAPPVNNIAVTRMLVMIPNTAKTLQSQNWPGILSSDVLQMRNCSKSCLDDLQKSVCIRGASLKLNGNARKQ